MAPYRNPAAMMAAKNWNQNVKNMTTVNPISRTLARDLTGAEDLMRKFLDLTLVTAAPLWGDFRVPLATAMSAVAAGRGAAFWQSLVRPGRAVYFPNIDLRLVPPNAEANAHEVGMDVVTFITRPAVTKVDVKECLEKVYGVGVERVHTVNYEGKKKRRGNYFYHRPDYKKVYVQLRERWYPPKGFAVTAIDGDVDKGHKVKASPVKSGPKGYWLHNVVTRKAGDSEYQE